MRLATVIVLTFGLCMSAATALGDSVDARGRSLLNSLGCKACHAFDGTGGQSAPALDAVGSRLTGERIRQQLVSPAVINPDTGMPSYAHLGEQQIETLVEFLSRRK